MAPFLPVELAAAGAAAAVMLSLLVYKGSARAVCAGIFVSSLAIASLLILQWSSPDWTEAFSLIAASVSILLAFWGLLVILRRRRTPLIIASCAAVAASLVVPPLLFIFLLTVACFFGRDCI